MSPPQNSQDDDLTEAQMVLINQLCNQFEAKWRRGETVRVEELLIDVTVQDRLAALQELLPLEIEYRCRAGQTLTLKDYTSRFPDLDRSWIGELLDTTRVVDHSVNFNDPLDISDVPQKLGDYRIVSRIGGGGMGIVYKAIHERMGRVVALKVLRNEIQQDPHLMKRFDREVRAAARLTHPNIVAALDAREQDGLHYLITEYVDGIDLQLTVIQDGPLSVAAAVDCILQAARGLDFAHRHGVIHRDIKPANLLRDAQGVVKVLDMGLARLESPDVPLGSDLTQSGMVMGTAAYMSPEQARDTHRADARSDIYSLGCTLFYLLNGRSVFTGASVIDTIISHVNHPIPTLSQVDSVVPEALELIFHRMVAKAPDDRYQSVAELITVLENVRKELPTEYPRYRDATQVAGRAETGQPDQTKWAGQPQFASTPTEMVQHPRRVEKSRRNQRRILLGSAILLITAGLAYYFTLPRTRSAGLKFDGRSSYVVVPELIPKAGEIYTLEVIAKPEHFQTSNMISWLGPDWMALFILDSGHWGVCRRVGDRSILIQSNEPAEYGKTVHLAGVSHGELLKLFVNGRAVDWQPIYFDLAATTQGGLHIGGVPLQLLPENQNVRFFQGTIRAVRISRGIRYQGPFRPPSKFETDGQTIAFFPFDEGHGTETRGHGRGEWKGEIVDAKWILEPILGPDKNK